MGFDTVRDGENVIKVPKFTDAHQVLMLLNAIGIEEQEVLVASGIDIDDDTNYNVLVDALVATTSGRKAYILGSESLLLFANALVKIRGII